MKKKNLISDNLVLSNMINENKSRELLKEKYPETYFVKYDENELIVNQVTCGSKEKLCFNCIKYNHEFCDQVYKVNNRLINNVEVCKVCIHLRQKKGENLVDIFPNLLDVIDYQKNRDEKIFENINELKMGQNVWIIYEENSKKISKMSIVNDIINGYYKKKELDKERSFGALSPQKALAVDLVAYYEMYTEEYCIEKYGKHKGKKVFEEGYNPYKLAPYSTRVVPFRCHLCGEISYKSIRDITLQTYGCSCVLNSLHSSIPEQIIYLLLKKCKLKVSNKYRIEVNGNRKVKEKMELDIYCKKYKFAIEYDGGRHDNSEKSVLREKNKYLYCQKNSIFLIRIKEKLINFTGNYADEIIGCEYDNEYVYIIDVINQLYGIIGKYLHKEYNINFTYEILESIEEYISEAKNNFNKVRIDNSLANEAPACLRAIRDEERELAYKLSAKCNHMYNCICENCNHIYPRTSKNLYNTKAKCPKCHFYYEDIKNPSSKMVRWYLKANYNKSLGYKFPNVQKIYSNLSVLSIFEIYPFSTYPCIVECPFCKKEIESSPKILAKNKYHCKYCGKAMLS